MIDKWLTAIGLIFEFFSVFLIVKDNLFLDYEKYISTRGKRTSEEIAKSKREARITVGFLAVGMVLQGIALFL